MAAKGNQHQDPSDQQTGPVVAGVPIGRVAQPATDLRQAELGEAGVAGHAAPVPYRPTAVAVVTDLPTEEIIVLNYRRSVICFAIIDAVFTGVNVASGIIGLVEGDRLKNTLGYSPIGGYWIFGVVALLLLAGPLCGAVGASRLNRGLVMVYMVFCAVKFAFQIWMSFATPFLWFIISALIQLWITKITCQFWSALGLIVPEHRKLLLDPDYIQNAPVRVVYW